MSELEIAAIVVASVVVYVTAGGAAWALYPQRKHDGVAEVFIAIGWPLVLPAWLGVAIVRRLQAPRLPRAEVRR